ncbi:hypothetical protein [Marinobacter nitratireducens]|uniref:hypothetical protein n=1 Tax=Marinobacter nitratireducens TaxID=1137280 RepID=UPI0005673839|nr:hypothetical protein [Marinobacter nitratireducens]
MSPVTYSDGVTPVRVGDAVTVTVKAWWIFPSKKNGQVTYVHDPKEKVRPHVNDVGVEVSLSKESSLFFSLVNGRLPSAVAKRGTS